MCCHGEIRSIPWSDESSLYPETEAIRGQLARLCEPRYLTMSSQPAVSDVRSDNKVHGWGPKNGYVYKRSIIFVFVSPEDLNELVSRIEEEIQITYYAVSQSTESMHRADILGRKTSAAAQTESEAAKTPHSKESWTIQATTRPTRYHCTTVGHGPFECSQEHRVGNVLSSGELI
ncbi:hypothetical protein EC957_007696 [Mortierella hygrophila]|uniref:MTHFR SAM-binding regulatory domain-containing protein n=1 Tax=Mortierella hygrophila TaxID=979708 RepID=A0A9P6EXW3_9FUNG|nr:hypothetical protein EC957_007696 [Mortierella hygrophila]